MLNHALTIIQEEHRSLGAVLHGLRFLVKEMLEKKTEPDFKLMWSMIYYMDAFSQRLHDPREEAYLFSKLQERTGEADQLIADLKHQHAASVAHLRNLELMLGEIEAGVADKIESFAASVENMVNEARHHMQLEEKTVIPLAKKYLTAEDWIEIAAAFGEHGDPRFGPKPEHEFRDLFTRIVNLAPPPIGVGPLH